MYNFILENKTELENYLDVIVIKLKYSETPKSGRDLLTIELKNWSFDIFFSHIYTIY